MVCSIVGIYAIKAMVKAIIDAILSLKVPSWKKIPKLMIPSNHKGIKTVTIVSRGNLYKGKLNVAY
jgi:hypothetical protein